MDYEKKLKAIKRKHHQALKPMQKVIQNENTYFEFKPMKDSVEATTFFRYDGTKYRFDFEYYMTNPLPRVAHIRNLLWETMKEYRAEGRSAQHHLTPLKVMGNTKCVPIR